MSEVRGPCATLGCVSGASTSACSTLTHQPTSTAEQLGSSTACEPCALPCGHMTSIYDVLDVYSDQQQQPCLCPLGSCACCCVCTTTTLPWLSADKAALCVACLCCRNPWTVLCALSHSMQPIRTSIPAHAGEACSLQQPALQLSIHCAQLFLQQGVACTVNMIGLKQSVYAS